MSLPLDTLARGARSRRISHAEMATIAAIVGLVGVPFSMAGAELTSHFARRRVIVSVMLLSVVASTPVMFCGTARTKHRAPGTDQRLAEATAARPAPNPQSGRLQPVAPSSGRLKPAPTSSGRLSPSPKS
jgi:hypothetical protein